MYSSENTKPTLIVPAQAQWDEFLSKDHYGGCSGLGSCEYCNKKMYPLRTGYLKSWIRIYLKNKQDIDAGNVQMPRLQWCAADYANKFIVKEYHQQHCNQNKSITVCDCDIACLLRAMYHITDDDTLHSLDQIIPVFRKMQKQFNKSA